MKILYLPIFFLFAFLNFADARTWTDTQGRSFEGDFISSNGNEVTIRRSTDGQSFTVPVNILSDNDQSYLAQITQSARGFSHRNTGLILPSEIEGLKIGKEHAFDDPKLGVAVSYFGENVTATIYIYNYGKDDLRDDPEHRLISSEISEAISEIKRAEEMGIYKDVILSDTGNMSGKDGTYTFISIPASYVQVKDTETKEPISPVKRTSLIGVGLYKGHYIKLRYSINPGSDLDASIKQRDAFVSALNSLVREVDLRPMVEAYLATYFSDPLSPEAREVLGGITAYSEMSRLVKLTINYEVAPWLQIEDYPYGYELLGAYSAGQVHAQLSSGIFRSNEQAGREQVLKVYKILRSKDRRAIIKELEDDLSSREIK